MEKQNNDSQDTRILDDRTDGGKMILGIYDVENDVEKLIDVREIACFITSTKKRETPPVVLNVIHDTFVEIHLKSGTIITAKYNDKIADAITGWEKYVMNSYEYEMNRR